MAEDLASTTEGALVGVYLPFTAEGILQCQRAYLKYIGKCEDLGEGGALTPGRDCIDDIGTKGCGIVFNVHSHFAFHSNLQRLLAVRITACSTVTTYLYRSTA